MVDAAGAILFSGRKCPHQVVQYVLLLFPWRVRTLRFLRRRGVVEYCHELCCRGVRPDTDLSRVLQIGFCLPDAFKE